MKRTFHFILILIAFFISIDPFTYGIHATKTSLSGKITDKKTGEAIPGATVYIPEFQSGAMSDSTGFYRIDNLHPAKVVVQVSSLGYKTIVESIDLSLVTTMNFELEETFTEIDEVVVTGTLRTTEVQRNPLPVVAMGRIDLQQDLNTNIIDAITKLPGVSAVSTGPNVSKPSIRGLGYNRVLTLFNGVRQEGQQWGDEHGIEVDENAVDRIEVIKGPASLTYGPDALAGVVNILSVPPVPDGTVSGQVSTNYQTNNELAGISASINGNKNGILWGGVASHKQATNYRDRVDGRVYGTAFNETDLSGYAGLNKHWGYSHLNFSVFNDLQEIPDGSRDSVSRRFTKQITDIDTVREIVPNSELNSYKITPLHQHIQHYRLYSTNNLMFGKHKIGLILGYQQNIREEFSYPQYPATPGLGLTLKTFTYDVKYSYPVIEGWETSVGVNGMYQKNINKGTEFIIPDYSLFDFGAFMLIQKRTDKFDLGAGLRYDYRFLKVEGMYTRPDPQTGFDMRVSIPDTVNAIHPFNSFNRSFSGISASIGATYKVTKDILIKANIARGFRTPNIAEISANGIHPGTLIYQIGDINFRPEFSLQEDLGISFASGHFSGSLDLFNNNISNYIFNQKLLNGAGQDSIIVKGNQTFVYQQSNAQLYGGEASLDIHPHPLDWIHFENSISVIYALNRGGNGIIVTPDSKYLPLIPPLHTNTELRANIKRKLKFASSIYVKIGMEYYAKQNRVYSADNTETPTNGYILYNAGAGANITNRKGKVILIFNILGSNITDVIYQSHLSRLKYFEPYPGNLTGRSGIYNMGRNISFQLILPMKFRTNIPETR
ncbi:MAG: TonB-dependent receptor [Bacteroidales bacterium]|jgi:iron complex outermembrane receptor protein